MDDVRHARAAVDTLHVGDVDHPANAAPHTGGIGAGAEVAQHHRAVGWVVDADLAKTVNDLQACGARIGGVHQLPGQLDEATLDLFAIQHKAPTGHRRVVIGADVAVAADQRIQAIERGRALGPARRQPIGVGKAGAGLQAVELGVKGHAATRRRDQGAEAQRVVVLPRGHFGVQRGLLQAKEAGRSGQHRVGGQVDLQAFHTALDEAVDVEVTRTNDHAAIGHDAGACWCAGRTAASAALGIGRRVTRRVVEAVDKALHKVAVVGLDVDLCRSHVLVGIDAARLAVDPNLAQWVADVAVQLDVGRWCGQVRVLGAVGVVVADDLHFGQTGSAVVAGLQGQRRRCAAGVDAADLGVVVDQEAVEPNLATAFAGHGQLAQHQEVGRVVDDADLGVAGGTQRTRATQAVGLDADVAQAHRDVAHPHKVGRRAIGGRG